MQFEIWLHLLVGGKNRPNKYTPTLPRALAVWVSLKLLSGHYKICNERCDFYLQPHPLHPSQTFKRESHISIRNEIVLAKNVLFICLLIVREQPVFKTIILDVIHYGEQFVWNSDRLTEWVSDLIVNWKQTSLLNNSFMHFHFENRIAL